ncbi:hypothetical protein MCANUFG4_01393 [Mycoplasmopsis canis UFG4]|uniref:Lipoprotein n=1 Tax=Mycoplasmopsis canis UFG4 TaxID=1131455 RepID=I1A6X6_9BACT|nr:hypothetical protein [Mycoplasmopsis canis]EIE42051.1 hypothetical protein MCANUFG1_01373 [Mycoplasmopsis canis UFG1]EIE42247.1 hypothetical protein MCANUFG4_01393 [Mycoplasmopsis canis UFG4]
MFKINKKIKFLFTSSIFAAAIPFTAVSCLYENDSTVVYAKSFIKENGFLDKERVANKNNKVLLDFENNLYTTNFLTYDFSSINLRFKFNRIEINNKHLSKKIENLLDIKDKSISIIQNKYLELQKIIQQGKEDYKKYLTNNPSKNDQNTNDIKLLLNENDLVLNNFDKKIELVKDKINEYYNKNKGTKTLKEILKLDFEDREETEAIKNEKFIKSNLSSILNVNVYDLTLEKLDLVITYDQIEEILENFVKNTPWAAYYYWFKYEKNATTKSSYKPIADMLTFDKSSLSYIIEFSPLIINNGIPSSIFQIIRDKVQKTFDNKLKKNNSKKVLKTIWNEFIKISPSYNVDSYLIESTDQGITSGFGPIHLAQGVNSATGNKDDKFKIFNEPLTNEQTPDFLQNPKKYLEMNIDKIFLEEKEHNVLIEIQKRKSNIDGLKKQISNSKDKKQVNNLKSEIRREERAIKNLETKLLTVDKFRKDAAKVLEELKKSPNSSDLKSQLDKIKEPFTKDIETVTKRLKEGIEVSQTSHFSLANLFSNLLFLNGVYKTQVIKGYSKEFKLVPKAEETDDPRTRKIFKYWVEFEENGQWYIFDVYQLLKDFQQLKSEIIIVEKYIYSSLSELNGWKIDEHYINNANVR